MYRSYWVAAVFQEYEMLPIALLDYTLIQYDLSPARS
jgi:hypothetical protein